MHLYLWKVAVAKRNAKKSSSIDPSRLRRELTKFTPGTTVQIWKSPPKFYCSYDAAIRATTVIPYRSDHDSKMLANETDIDTPKLRLVGRHR